ncbi:MAG: carboxymuconolactone decarboxylase family protein [Gammaproteobacteria bacterium]|nr:carboxymuconolactone decarboxylase family protein [Gammaproteobacteria bacterium]MBU0785568.1 carboxymuconolactone decarboxylase family protein [Gammaproteobacteria bacterium]MBU0816856.1 carboxymuconolactone decarboxylase family protein [Gammaproteobacteria bacterium]MBU1787020.1 carboxymuconolactone decarboxylase family protein [Gammaproteobacteria bacterium]
MPRLQPLPPDTTPELKPHFDFFLGTLGFTPNSVLTMQRKPKIVQAFAQLNAAVMDPAGEVDLGFRRLVGHVVSKVSGCLYCQAHTLLGAHNFGVSDAKLADVWAYASSPHYSPRERVALDFAMAAASQPNAVTDELFAEVQQYWSEGEIVELLGVVAMFAFLNRWNDTLGTPLEAVPAAVAGQALGAQGWTPGKHSL